MIFIESIFGNYDSLIFFLFFSTLHFHLTTPRETLHELGKLYLLNSKGNRPSNKWNKEPWCLLNRLCYTEFNLFSFNFWCLVMQCKIIKHQTKSRKWLTPKLSSTRNISNFSPFPKPLNWLGRNSARNMSQELYQNKQLRKLSTPRNTNWLFIILQRK